MTSLQIQYFLAVADNMSFSLAAKSLFVSQPSVSRQVKLLESELGYPLFDRTSKNRIRLTAAGVLFLESFRSAAREFERARAAAKELAVQTPLRLRVGVGAGWDLSAALGDFRARVLRQYPQAVMTFEFFGFQSLRDKLRSNDLDVILCTKTSIPDFEGLEVMHIANSESRAYVKKGLLRPEGEPLRVEDLAGRRLLMLREEEAPMAMELVQILLQARQIKVEPVWLPNRDTILQQVLLGDGFTVFDQYMYFANDPRLTHLLLDDTIPICAAWQRDQSNPLIPLLAESLTAWFSRPNGCSMAEAAV